MNGIGSSFEVQTHLSVHVFSIDVRSWWTTRMGQPLESERRYVAVSAKGCRKIWEDVELARWAMASVASTRSQVKSLVLPWRRRSTVSWRCHPAGGPQSLPSGMVVEEPCFLVPSQQGSGHAEIEEVQHLLAGGRSRRPSSFSAVARAHQSRDGPGSRRFRADG